MTGPSYLEKYQGNMKKVNVAISEEMHTKAKIISVLKGINLNDYLAKAIEKAVEKDKEVLTKLKE